MQRRKFIASSLSGLALATPAVGSVTADGSTGAAEIGIENSVTNLIQRGKFEQANRLLENHDVRYDANLVRMPAVGTEGDVGTQDEWNKSSSSFYHSSWNRYGDIYRSYAYWTLRDGGSYECAGPGDGVGVTVNPDLWEPVLNSWEFDGRSTLDERGSKGVVTRFDDPEGPADAPYSDRTGHLQVDLEKTESGSHNVYGTYTHTWLPGCVPGGVSFGLAVGPISVSASGGTDTWSKRADNNL